MAYTFLAFLLVLLLYNLSATARPPPIQAFGVETLALNRRDPSDYPPSSTACPSQPYTRSATDINPAESTYVASRASNAAKALQSWLSKTNPDFGQPSAYPTLALASSGGGLRATLTGAGVHQAFDDRESNPTCMGGLYQALTYESALSGGSWLVGSLAAANWPTVSSLQSSLWTDSFNDGLLLPGGLTSLEADGDIIASMHEKDDAGFPITIVDAWGRLEGYALIQQGEGGISQTMSGLTQNSQFTSQAVPFPIFTAIGVQDADEGSCIPVDASPQFEMTPYEFGSWEKGYANFVQMKFLGSSGDQCTIGYDRLTYMMGASSDLLNEAFSLLPQGTTQVLQDVLDAFGHTTSDCQFLLAAYPNPWSGDAQTLYLTDGGETTQNDPIWPFLNHRQVDVLFVTDVSADDAQSFPNGTEMYHTYQQAQSNDLTRMPIIPDVDTFKSQGLAQRPTFFGCNSGNDIMTIIWLPNRPYTYASNQSAYKLQYDPDVTSGMIKNGNAVATFNFNDTFAECVGCAITKKTGTTLPEDCQSCFDDFCFN